jgi:hypothetical protein
MQRAAASAATNAASTSITGATTKVAAENHELGTPSPKRQRLSSSNHGTPSSLATQQPSSDLQAISSALEAEEKKRAQAVARQAAEAGETEWVLDFPGISVLNSNDSAATGPFIVDEPSLDVGDEDIDFGRRSYGNFKRKKTANVGIAGLSIHLSLE